MLMHEEYEMLDGLVDGIEQLYSLAYAQRMLLTALYGSEWEPHVAYAQAEISQVFAELFSPLRDAIAGAHDGSYPARYWPQAVQNLVDTVTPPKAHS